MPDPPPDEEWCRRLGYRRVNLVWSKAEIFLGLTAAGLGLFLGVRVLSTPDPLGWMAGGDLLLVVAGLLLFVLGLNLALAGHRSHLYRSLNEQSRFLLEEIRRCIRGQKEEG